MPRRVVEAVEAAVGQDPEGDRRCRPGLSRQRHRPGARRGREARQEGGRQLRAGRAAADRAGAGEIGGQGGARCRRRSPPRTSTPRSTTCARAGPRISASAEDSYEALSKYARDLTEAAARRQDRPDHRPRRGDPPHDAGAVAPDQEQPGADRRTRHRQDRDRRGPGAAHHQRRRARKPEEQEAAGARHGRADRRREVPRRVRGAAEGGARTRSPPRRARSSCSSTRCTRWSAPARRMARWTRPT